MEEKTWTTKEGEEIPYSKIEDSHLLNILKWIEKNAEDGVEILFGGGGIDIDDMWGDKETLYGQECKDHYDFTDLTKEALRRDLITVKEYILRI